MTFPLRIALFLTFLTLPAWTEDSAPTVPAEPVSLVDGAKVVTLWPAGHPTLKNVDQKEVITFDKTNPKRIEQLKNVHNPSIELHLAAPEKANGAAIIIAGGGGNKTLCLDAEGLDVFPAWMPQPLRHREPTHAAVHSWGRPVERPESPFALRRSTNGDPCT